MLINVALTTLSRVLNICMSMMACSQMDGALKYFFNYSHLCTKFMVIFQALSVVVAFSSLARIFENV